MRSLPIDFSEGAGEEEESICTQDGGVDYAKSKSGRAFNCHQFPDKKSCEVVSARVHPGWKPTLQVQNTKEVRATDKKKVQNGRNRR